jgi:hypothetical protein
MNLTSSDDEARVFKSEELQASLVATLDALAAAIAQKKAEIVSRSTHPEGAFTLSVAPEATVPVVVGTQEARIAVVVDTQEAQASPTSTRSAKAQEKVPLKEKVVSELGTEFCRRRIPETSTSPSSRVMRSRGGTPRKQKKPAPPQRFSRRNLQTNKALVNLKKSILVVTRPEHENASTGEPVQM